MVFNATDYTGSFKSSYHMIMTTTACLPIKRVDYRLIFLKLYVKHNCPVV